jgi:hypothetical protein
MRNEKVWNSIENSLAVDKQTSNDGQTLINKYEEFGRRQIFTDKEASAYLRISQITLWRLRKAGKICFHRAASKLIYTRGDLDSYLDSTKQKAFGVTEVCNEK